ncbi:hypothetical protein SAMN05443545_1062 [Aidingimonas halophila]|uniref:Dolichyl-phosphate-mannose-protein mannosyltransferase n=2 Tax=Aidingimonas halophila TaxID=574349 RepID=A0A1H3CFQ1_9GAMM|nr:hypothetical protein SAMN05443545_1062 [Aidingimonas halophila]
MYHRASLMEHVEFELGTSAVIFINSFFSDHLGLSFLGCFFVFNIFGVIGILAFYACMKSSLHDKSPYLKYLALIIVFLPSVNFWSSAIGKDSIAFMATGLALWASLNLHRRMPLMVMAVLVMLVVRPHMAGLMVIALSVSFVFSRNVTLLQRIVCGVASVAAAAVMIPMALEYAGVGDGSDVDAVVTYIEGRQGENMSGGSSVDIASMSLPMQLFTYMFRPLIFEARSIFQLAAAVDNIILLCLFAFGGWAVFKGRMSHLGDNRTFLWVYALLSWGILAMTTANLGIAVRQKWMIAPVLIYLLISVLGEQRAMKREKPVSHGSHSI